MGLPEIILRNEGNLRELCMRLRVRTLYLFGSAAKGNGFDPSVSDLDFLVEFEPQERRGLDDVYFRMKEELEAMFGCRVDLVEVGTVTNPYVLRSIEGAKVPVYAAA